MSISPKIPTVNQILTVAIALVIIGFAIKLLPAQYQQYFRV